MQPTVHCSHLAYCYFLLSGFPGTKARKPLACGTALPILSRLLSPTWERALSHSSNAAPLAGDAPPRRGPLPFRSLSAVVLQGEARALVKQSVSKGRSLLLRKGTQGAVSLWAFLPPIFPDIC
ncbi:MAG: hypothetical protein AAF975_06715 [Spirochaetota bacterium]